MADSSLPEPVAQLLEMGFPIYARDFTWPNYPALGIRVEHIPALINLAVDPALLNCPNESDARCWAPVHAWRALGQLRAQEAIEPLLRLFHEVPDNDWVIEEMPDVFALIGPAACPALVAYLRNAAYPTYSRLVAATSLARIALLNPATRGEAVDALVEQLTGYKTQTPGANGVLIANLVDLRAAEHADLIQKVFADSKVDRFIAGDWRDVKHRLRGQPDRPANPNENGLKKSAGNTQPNASRPAYQEPVSRPIYREPRTSPRRDL